MTTRVALYSAVGEVLTRYEVDVEAATLTRRESVTVPAVVQYAWPHPTRRYLYVSSSNRGHGMAADINHVSAWRIDPSDGALSAHGDPVPLRQRATHMCVDPSGRFALQAHNVPVPGITVHRIENDGRIGATVQSPSTLDLGIYPHQVMVAPSGRTVILVDRGNDAAGGKPEDPGALRLFRFDDGVLSPLAVIAPNGGYGFGPRHLDFHPSRPWVYVSLERQSQLYMYRVAGDNLEPQAAYTRDTLADRAHLKPRQLAGTIHVHPNGGVVYVANRADWTVEHAGQRVFGGGENSLAVYAIDPASGEPRLIQHADTHAYHVRTFALDPSGRLLVAASIQPLPVLEGDRVVNVPAMLSVFRVAPDGTLSFVRRYEVETDGKVHYWMGLIHLP